MEKRFTSRIDIKATDIKLMGQVAQNDHFSNLFVIRLVDGVNAVDISDTDFVTVTYLLNGNSICVDATSERVSITDYENGEISIILPDGAIVYTGDIIATVELYSETDGVSTKLTTGRFAFRVVSDLSLTRGVNIEITEDQMSIIQAMATAERGRRSAETGRVSAEALRVSAETRRREAESDRASAEDDRVSNEDGRVEAEGQRVTDFDAFMEEAQEGVQDLWDAYLDYNPSITVNTNTTTEYKLNINYTDRNGDDVTIITPNLKGAKGDAGQGSGDMLKSVYAPSDTQNQGIVDHALLRDNATDSTKLGGYPQSFFRRRLDTEDDFIAVRNRLTRLENQTYPYIPQGDVDDIVVMEQADFDALTSYVEGRMYLVYEE